MAFYRVWLSSAAVWLAIFCAICAGAKGTLKRPSPADTKPERFLHLISGKRVALVTNQSSLYQDSLLPERLLARGINVTKIFVPEHGFRGKADAGEHIENTIDSVTHLPVVSLYGKHKMPTVEDMTGIDVLVFDLQDVGVRFYTYISTLEYCLKACIENKVAALVLDRPNPNGFYVDGPILDTNHRSFVGMQPIPIVHGLTVGEYARMLIGEQWIANAGLLQLDVVTCLDYSHRDRYKLPVAPSPNLRDIAAIYAYPSLCLFEGTHISVGRGTDKPFRQYGAPQFSMAFGYFFVPQPSEGARHPLHEGKKCFGELVADDEVAILKKLNGKLNLTWLQRAYREYPDKGAFFTPFFDKLAGGDELRQQIINKTSEAAIRSSWAPELKRYKQLRRKYLLYEDFK
jgi:uncharacterized protein YbbC (DUF1343 family)